MSGLGGWRDDRATGLVVDGDVARLLVSLTCPQGRFVTKPQHCDVGMGLVSASTHPGLSCLRAAVQSVTNSQGSVT